jgi:hypothetical protein
MLALASEHPLDMVHERRKELAKLLEQRLGSKVVHGAFRGLTLSDDQSWGGAERPAMLLGLYEHEVVERLFALPDRVRTFIDVGAADGFFAVGTVRAGRFQRAICYEISEAGRRAIRANAIANGVDDRIEIRGGANVGFFREFSEGELADAAVLMDVEGAEFMLLDADALERLQHSYVIVELHSGFVPDGEARSSALVSSAGHYFDVDEFTTGPRDLSAIPELRDMTDSDRWLLCSEGRPYRMSWVLLRPKRPFGAMRSVALGHQPA